MFRIRRVYVLGFLSLIKNKIFYLINTKNEIETRWQPQYSDGRCAPDSLGVELYTSLNQFD